MRRSSDDINKKCLLLQDLGFQIEHTDSQVSFNGQLFDFSAVACDTKSIMYHALETMYQHGREQGKDSIRGEFRSLLGLK